MPLVANLFKEGDEQEKTEPENGNHLQDKHNFPEKQVDEYYQYEQLLETQDQVDDEIDPDMLARPRPRKLVPDLPQKSRLRTSRILDSLTLDLQDLGRVKLEDQESLYSNPHDLYLSSEEDGSASGDDYEDVASDDDQNGDDSSSSVRRHSYEETARAVSLKSVKPLLVEINHHPSPASYALYSLNNERRISVSSSKSQPLLTTLPPRSSSRPPLSLQIITSPSITTSITPPTQTQPSFLSSDPYPTESAISMPSPNNLPLRSNTASPVIARSEKTSSGWGSLRAVSRTLALARKKASMPKINLAYTAGVVTKRNSTSPSNAAPMATLLASSTESISSSEAATPPPLPARRRSQTFDRLVAISSREGRRQSSDWSALNSPITPIQPNIEMQQDPNTATSPVEQMIASIPSITTTPITRTPIKRQRSQTTASTSNPSNSHSRSRSRSVTRIEDSKSASAVTIPSTSRTTSSYSQEIPTSSKTSEKTKTKSPTEKEREKETKISRRMTAFPDYSRSGRVARDREQQRRESNPSGRSNASSMQILSPGSETVGNTYHDIMKSVAVGIVEKEGRHGMERESSGKVVRPKGSMAMLAGVGVGFRRGKGGR